MKREIIDRFSNRAVVSVFANNNPAFDYMIHLPVRFGLSIWIFGETKSRGQQEGGVESNPGEPEKDVLFVGPSVKNALTTKTGKNQYDCYINTMNRTHCFLNQECGYMLFADFPLETNSRYKEVEAIENCVFEFAGDGFGTFLKNFVLNRELYGWDGWYTL